MAERGVAMSDNCGLSFAAPARTFYRIPGGSRGLEIDVIPCYITRIFLQLLLCTIINNNSTSSNGMLEAAGYTIYTRLAVENEMLERNRQVRDAAPNVRYVIGGVLPGIS